jgi:hypothetical protein
MRVVDEFFVNFVNGIIPAVFWHIVKLKQLLKCRIGYSERRSYC